MEDRFVVCEKTGQRFKVSPTAGSSVHLQPVSSELGPKHESNVAEKLGAVRKELAEAKKEAIEAKNDFALERRKTSMFRSALQIRKTYIQCPECDSPVQAGEQHRSHCRHFDTEQYMH